ncbi:hypothetical protein NX871_30905, partial [Burkholderia thailandensis]|uniref:hypothetical protein n=1 Tax=Burkholderia thailandensis TaxID=57975 RepID=UPI00217CEDC5
MPVAQPPRIAPYRTHATERLTSALSARSSSRAERVSLRSRARPVSQRPAARRPLRAMSLFGQLT